jgi:UDP-glucose 4-epimerase
MHKILGQRWLVLGASGFIGTNLCRRLVQGGAEVVAFGRQTNMPVQLEGCRWVAGNFFDQDSLAVAMDEAEIVVHSISTVIPATSNESPINDVKENLLGTLKLLDLCKRKAVKRLLVLSSGGTIYGPNVTIPTPENAPNEPICSYGIVKLAIEKYLQLYRRQGELDSVVLRLANPFGPYQRMGGQGLIAAVIHKILQNQPVEIWGDGSVIRDYIYIADVVDAILSAAELNNFNNPFIYNIGSGVGRSVNTVIESLMEIHGAITVDRLPNRHIDVPVSILDICRAESFLDWRPQTDWMDALQLTYSWFKQAGKFDGLVKNKNAR